MKRILKGYFIWISNNALLLTALYCMEKAIVTQSTEYIVATVIISLLWFTIGHIIVSMFCMVDKIVDVKLEPIGVAKEISSEEEI